MNYNNLAKNTGFLTVQNSNESFYPERMVRRLADPVEDISRSGFAISYKKDNKIRELVRKAPGAYMVDAMVRQAVDKYSELFKSFNFQGGESQVKYLKQRLTMMTLQTGEHWETFITRVINEYFKTGNAFIVKRRGRSASSIKRSLYKNKPYPISGLSLVSPERLDISRNKEGEFDGWEIFSHKNESFSLVLPGSIAYPTGQGLIKTIEPSKPNVLVPGLDIVHVAYKKGADTNYGFGLILAALEDISMTRIIEQITAVMIKKFSNPIIHHKIIRPASPLAGMQQEINMSYDLWRRIAPDGILITGGNSEIKAIGSESQALRVEGYLKYFLYRSLAGLGISPYIAGLEGGGQGTLEASVELMMMKVRFCQSEIARELEMFIFNELLWEGGFDPYTNENDVVKLIFEDIDESRTIKLQTHAADMFQKNMWGHREARRKGGDKESVDDNDLYLNKIDIPKTRSEKEVKDSNKVVAAKKPLKKRKAKEVLQDLEGLIPTTESELDTFLILMNKLSYDGEALSSLRGSIKNLLGDSEAIKILLMEKLSNECHI